MVQLKKQCIILELEATDKAGVLHELAGTVHANHPLIDQDSMTHILANRELLGSTGVGNGIAIPHGKVPNLDKLLLCLGRSTAGISFDAVDNRPVHLFVMILSPTSMAGEYLQTLAQTSKVLKDTDLRNKILAAGDAETIVQLFNRL